MESTSMVLLRFITTTIAARFGDHSTSASDPETDALTAFIGSVDTGDPDWASTDAAVLREAADTRRSA